MDRELSPAEAREKLIAAGILEADDAKEALPPANTKPATKPPPAILREHVWVSRKARNGDPLAKVELPRDGLTHQKFTASMCVALTTVNYANPIPRFVVHGGQPCHVIRVSERQWDGTQKQRWAFDPISSQSLRTLAEYAGVQTGKKKLVKTGMNPDGTDVKKLRWVPCTMTDQDARAVLASEIIIRDGLPVVQDIAHCRMPLLRNRELVWSEPGYDSELAIWTDPEAPEISPMPVDEALDVLNNDLMGDFCWYDSTVDRACALAWLLTPLCRYLLGPCDRPPAYLFHGNRVGLGKDLMLSLAPIITMGMMSGSRAPAKDDNENRKAIVAAILAGDWFFCISNIRGKMEDESLEQAATSTVINARQLGGNTNLTLSNRLIMAFSANHARANDDMQRRFIEVQLFSDEANLDARKYKHPGLEQWALDNRPRLLSALASLVNHWHQRGCPGTTRNPKRGFTRWSNTVAAIVEQATEEEFSPLDARHHDLSRLGVGNNESHIAALLPYWHKAHGTDPITSTEIQDLMRDNDLCPWYHDNDQGTRTRITQWFRANGGIWRGGLKVEPTDARLHNRHTFRLVVADNYEKGGE